MSDPKPQPRSKFDILADQVRRAILPSKPPTEKPLLPPGLGGPNDTVAEFAKGLLGLKQEPGMTPSGVGAVLGAVLPVAGATKALGRSVRAAKGLKAAEEVPQGIIAYHGSPHDFDKFDLSKIGTGEGAQAYGHGLYFAENEGVARGYRDGLSPVDLKVRGVPAVKWEQMAPGMRGVKKGSMDAAKASGLFTPEELDAISQISSADLDHVIKELRAQGNMEWRSTEARSLWNRRADVLEKLRPEIEASPTGKTYQVRINASPDEFLDWDKPLSEQGKVAELLRKAGYADNSHVFTPEGAFPMDEYTGEHLLDAYRTTRGTDVASRAGRMIGIKGIKYLDAGSRSTGEGSRNYVVFDDALVEILKKYGFLPPLAAGAAASYQSRLDAAKQKGGS